MSGPKEISPKANKINVLASKSTQLEISPQGHLALGIEKAGDFGEVGMGVLSDGTPYLNQRGLAVLCGVENAHIGTISSQWNDEDPKPRIRKIKNILDEAGFTAQTAHVEIVHGGRRNFCYPAEICLAVLEYYALDAGANVQDTARKNYRLLAGSKLREMIYSNVGYDPTGADRFKKWHDRIALNFKAAPRGYFDVFNEAHTIVYELIVAGAEIGEKTVVDISIGQHWGRCWEEKAMHREHGHRIKYPHNYPDSHPQSRANPHESWCYPLSALGPYREWLQDTYLGGGKFKGYLEGKVKKGDLAPSVAQLAIETLAPAQLTKG